MQNIPMKEIMTKEVIRLHFDETFSHVREKMQQHHIRHLPVVNDENKLVGIITQRDFYKAYTPRKTPEGDYYDKTEMDRLIVKHVMTKIPMTLSPDDKLTDAVKIMAKHKYGAVPIIDHEGKLTGIVTQIDILKRVAKHLI